MREVIENLWQSGQQLQSNKQAIETIEKVLDNLDHGAIRAAEKVNGVWQVNEWIKKSILLYFRTHDMIILPGFGNSPSWDKIPLKVTSWQTTDFAEAGFRMIPGAIIRKGSFIAPSTVILPSFINIGAYIDTNTMIDSWVTVGSCAQIGKNCHISAGVNIGGVLEPIQASPVIIEDNVFIGAGSQIVEGIIIEEGAVIGAGVVLSASTKIYDQNTGQIFYGRVPAYSVVVSGMINVPDKKVMVNAAIIVKQVDAKTRSKTGINELLRDD